MRGPRGPVISREHALEYEARAYSYEVIGPKGLLSLKIDPGGAARRGVKTSCMGKLGFATWRRALNGKR